MNIDFEKYKNTKGDLIIKRLDTEITGKHGDTKITTHTILSKKFTVDLNSFYQVNNEMMGKAYIEMINYVPENSVVFYLLVQPQLVFMYQKR